MSRPINNKTRSGIRSGFCTIYEQKKYLSEKEDELSPYYWFNVKPT
jgi:hypothetical protein